MILRTRGTVLGVRDLPANKKTGEASRWKMLDIYAEGDGPAELRLSVEVDSPETGTLVDVKVGVTAYSGFVRDGAAGDARIMFTAHEVLPVEPAVAAPATRPRAVRTTG